MSGGHILSSIDMDEVPFQFRPEIEKALGANPGHLHTRDLSPQAAQWLMHYVTHHADTVGEVEKIYTQGTKRVEQLIAGITHLDDMFDKAKADKLNLDLYNACAAFCRAYNEENL